MKNLSKVIEILEENGKVALRGDENIAKLQEALRLKGYKTSFEVTDREYLVRQ